MTDRKKREDIVVGEKWAPPRDIRGTEIRARDETYFIGQMDAVRKLELQCRVGDLDLTEGMMR